MTENFFLIILFSLSIIITIISTLFIIIFRDNFYTSVPFVSTRKIILSKIIEVLELNNESILYDLGSGDGRVLIEAARNFSGIKGIGIESGIFPFLISKIKSRNYNIQIKLKNILKSDLTKATHIYCYLSSEVMESLKSKIINECSIGTKIVSCDFPFVDWNPVKILDVKRENDNLGKKLFVYIK